LADLADRLESSGTHDVLVHGDLVPGNVILHRDGASFVDFEYAGRGDPAYDLGNLIASASLDRRSAKRLVRGYCQDDDRQDRPRWELRAESWSRVAQGGWVAWVVLGRDLGPRAAYWRRWAAAAAADLVAAQRRGSLAALVDRLDDNGAAAGARVAGPGATPRRSSV
jgi:thiamine kinase-like enzyme